MTFFVFIQLKHIKKNAFESLKQFSSNIGQIRTTSMCWNYRSQFMRLKDQLKCPESQEIFLMLNRMYLFPFSWFRKHTDSFSDCILLSPLAIKPHEWWKSLPISGKVKLNESKMSLNTCCLAVKAVSYLFTSVNRPLMPNQREKCNLVNINNLLKHAILQEGGHSTSWSVQIIALIPHTFLKRKNPPQNTIFFKDRNSKPKHKQN